MLSELNAKSRRVGELEATLQNYELYRQTCHKKEKKLKEVFTELKEEACKVTGLIMKADDIISTRPRKYTASDINTASKEEQVFRGARVKQLTSRLKKLTGGDKPQLLNIHKKPAKVVKESCSSREIVLEKLQALKGRLKKVFKNTERRISTLNTMIATKRENTQRPKKPK